MTGKRATPRPRTYLTIGYDDKDWAKRHGARWDKERKRWYVPGERQLPTGDGLPPVSQPFLEGLEADLPARSAHLHQEESAE